MEKKSNPKILVLDIETTPLEVYSWNIFDQTIMPNQIIKDWSILSWAACWLDEPKNIMYADTRGQKNVREDKHILKGIHKLMDEADIIIGQNSNRFDIKKLNTRFIANKMKPPSSYKKIDTKEIAKKYFAFTTASLDFMTKTLNSRQTKMKNSGLDLWIRCLNNDLKAFKELEKYNKQDVAATVELWKDLRPWDNSLNVNLYTNNNDTICSCGSKKFNKNGYAYTSMGKFQRFSCANCGTEIRSRDNLFSKDKRKSLKA